MALNKNQEKLPSVINGANIMPPNLQEQIEIAKQQNKALMLLMHELLEEGVDYGRVPGVPKPFLHQPGAQQLGLVFKMRPVFEKIDSVVDFNQAPVYISFEYKCKLYHRETGLFLGEGVGSANSYEKKFRYYKDGTENKDPLDKQNTLVKMAKKRAYVDATLNVTGASRLFTQDEDLVDAINTVSSEDIKNNPGDVVMNFGKHKGKKLKDIPKDYLEWLADNAKDENMREAAKAVLNPDRSEEPNKGITKKQKNTIKDYVDKLEISNESMAKIIYERYKKPNSEQMTEEDAENLIQYLIAVETGKEPHPDERPVDDEISDTDFDGTPFA